MEYNGIGTTYAWVLGYLDCDDGRKDHSVYVQGGLTKVLQATSHHTASATLQLITYFNSVYGWRVGFLGLLKTHQYQPPQKSLQKCTV